MTGPRNPSGHAPPGSLTSRGQRFTLQWSEDFAAATPAGSWGANRTADAAGPYRGNLTVQPDGTPDTSQAGRYTPSRVISTAGSCLQLALRVEDGVPLVAHIRPMWRNTGDYDGFRGQLYGRWAFRLKVIPGDGGAAGFKCAPLLWPKSERWPDDGEIDWPEASLAGNESFGFVHHQGGQGQTQVGPAECDLTSWHSFAVEWLPGRCSFLLDSRQVGEATAGIPATPMYPVLQFETDGGPPPARASARVLIDWIALWRI